MNDSHGSIIRLAVREDVPQITSLYKIVWDEYRGLFPDELIAAREPSANEMNQWMERENYFVAIREEKVIGIVGYSIDYGSCLLKHMVVHPQYRKAGIGSALIEKVIDAARQQGANKLWLDTVPILKEAIALYQKYGFLKCGHLKKHYWGADIELYELLLH